MENTILRRGLPELHPPAPAPAVPPEVLTPRDEAKAYAEAITGIVLGEGAEGEQETGSEADGD